MGNEWGKKEYKKLKEFGYRKLSKHNYGKIVVANCVIVMVSIYRDGDNVSQEIFCSLNRYRLVISKKSLSEILKNEKEWISNFLKLLNVK